MTKVDANGDSLLTDEDRRLLGRICEEVDVPAAIVEQMITAENSVFGMGRRHGIYETLESLVSKGLELSHPDEVRK